MRKLSFTTILLAAIAMHTAPGADPVRAADCGDLLGNNVYRCSVKADFGEQFEDCFRFSSPGELSLDFDLDVDMLLSTLACDCRTKGSFKKPKFGASTEFHCVTPFNDDLGIAFTGQAAAKGAKLKKVQAVNDEGDSFIAECVLDPACTVQTLAGGPPNQYVRK